MTNTHQNIQHRSFVPPQSFHFQVGFTGSLLTNHASIDVNQMYMMFFVNNEVDADSKHIFEKAKILSKSFIYLHQCLCLDRELIVFLVELDLFEG